MFLNFLFSVSVQQIFILFLVNVFIFELWFQFYLIIFLKISHTFKKDINLSNGTTQKLSSKLAICELAEWQ